MSENSNEHELVERATDDIAKLSNQPRFSGEDDGRVFLSLTHYLNTLEQSQLKPPEYIPNSKTRDQWLVDHWQLEPHWAGVVNHCVLIDSGRGWSLTGGRNQVYRYTDIMHASEGGKGWREYFRKASLSYRVTDIGSITEIGRDGRRGPLRALFHVDPTRCRWTGDIDAPLEYNPGKPQHWRQDDFFGICSLPSIEDEYRGLGWCQTSRAIEILRLLYGVFKHDQEMVGAAMPSGLLLLQNIDETHWEQAMSARESERTAKERTYFGGVMILAAMDPTQEPNAKLVALSQLPADFDRETFINQCMYAYALVSGYDPREFWPVSSGSFGNAEETGQQHEKASVKGALEFPHAWQERLQLELPDTLQFEFQERDDEGELKAAAVAQAWADVAHTLYEPDQMGGTPLLDRELVLSLLAERGIIPEEWTLAEEDVTATDEETARRRALDLPQVRRVAARFPHEPIIRYEWSPVRSREIVLWERGEEALRPRLWRAAKVNRQDEAVLYEDDDVRITEADVDAAIDEARRRVAPEFGDLMDAEVVE